MEAKIHMKRSCKLLSFKFHSIRLHCAPNRLDSNHKAVRIKKKKASKQLDPMYPDSEYSHSLVSVVYLPCDMFQPDQMF